MSIIEKGRYAARISASESDVVAAQRLRAVAFAPAKEAVKKLDQDEFDELCTHFLVEEAASGKLVCCFRMLPLADGDQIGSSYAAQYYELSALARYDGPMVEVGRFCIHPDYFDPDILRVAWAAITRYVDENSVKMLFGCSSFKGTDAERYFDAFAMLKDCHLAPRRWLPRVKAPTVFRFAQMPRMHRPNEKKAMLCMPPLLRAYLLMGGWVSDHAVVDRQMNTLHVFTGLEVRAIPQTRKRLLRSVVR